MKNQTTKRSLRGAIYTRVSTEQGLEQDFNSLGAQREACEAYIKPDLRQGAEPREPPAIRERPDREHTNGRPKDLARFGDILMREFYKTVPVNLAGKTVNKTQGEIVALEIVKNAILKGRPRCRCWSSSLRLTKVRTRRAGGSFEAALTLVAPSIIALPSVARRFGAPRLPRYDLSPTCALCAPTSSGRVVGRLLGLQH
jgi:hypothetical protein